MVERALQLAEACVEDMDGTGLGLVLHHKALGKYFLLAYASLVRNQIGLVKLVEETVRFEHALSPHKPIYLVGDSFGGCLALAVASRNPAIDLVLYYQIQLQPLFPILEAMPDELHVQFPIFLALSWGIDDIIPRDTFLWKLKLLKSAAAYANSRLHALKPKFLSWLVARITCFLVEMKPNDLRTHYKIVLFVTSRTMDIPFYWLLHLDSGSILFSTLEDGKIVKGLARVPNEVPVTPSNLFKLLSTKSHVLLYPGGSREALHYMTVNCKQLVLLVFGLWLFRVGTDPILFSTLEDGKIMKGLAGVPSEGPVLLVGNHMFMGLELPSLAEGFLREKNIMIRGLAHPMLFSRMFESSSSEFSITDWVKVFGAAPVTGSNFFKLLSTKSHVLLYPGGSREALHYKMLLDYNDLIKIPVVNDLIREAISQNTLKVRDETKGEVANPNLCFPLMVPKIPGRFYYLFGKPIKTKGREDILKDKQVANQLYLQIKAEVERNLAFLIEKREEDPYRSIVDRTLYKAIYAPTEVPAFET
ncbi:acyltransferase-like protein [Quercus suber]|uniref:Acyltransferase-like protein n=1 Tax=Quercus suber TaxID=58331 RepID=A0AAW0L9B3_QUESU